MRPLLASVFATPSRLVLIALLTSCSTLHAQLKVPDQEPATKSIDKGNELQRVPTNVYESLPNKISNVEFYSSNVGIFGLNGVSLRAGGIWPRGSGHNYIFGGGLWFGAKKEIAGGDMVKLSVMGYNPNSGASAFVPGRIRSPGQEEPADVSPFAISKYRLYNSVDYDRVTGQPLDPADAAGPYWPIWMSDMFRDRDLDHYMGSYIEATDDRRIDRFVRGPAIISDEDIATTYRDNDWSRYDSVTRDPAHSRGYPIGLQVEERIYGWGSGVSRDFLILSYTVINSSGEDLFDCYLAPVIDPDLGNASNDRARIAIEDQRFDSLDLAVVWSDAEASGRYGYLGLDFLETPAIDPVSNFVRRDRSRYDRQEQLGAATFQSWSIEEDPRTPEQRYDFMSSRERDSDDRPGDKRILFSTGPFNMHHGDSVRVVIGLLFANGKATVPTGLPSDMVALLELDHVVQETWDNALVVRVGGAESDNESVGLAGPHCSGSYPNPVGSAQVATILYELAVPSQVEMRLYDAVGREIKHRELGYQAERSNSVRVDCTDLPAGVYIYEICTPQGSDRGTMTVFHY